MKIRLLFFLLFTGRILSTHAQQSLYVSTKGSDGNSGTIKRPFLTLGKALAAAGKGTVTIQLRGGTYYLDQTLVIRDIASSSLQVTAFKGEEVNISAGRRLPLTWRPYKDGILQAAVPAGMAFERLYINRQLQVLARYPNYDSQARIFHGTAADAISPQRTKRWMHPEGGYVHAIHAYEWGGFHYRITGVGDSGGLTLEGGWQNNRPAAMHPQYLFVENIFEELDTAGEWWLDKEKHILYCYPPKDVDLPNALVEVSNLKNSIEIRGTAGTPVRNVRLSHLNFLHNERSFMETKEPLVRSDWTIYRGGAVLLEGTENCSVSDCNFTDIGGNAIMISNYNKADTIRGCHIRHIGANAICFIGSAKAVRSPSFRYEDYIPYARLDKTPGPLTNDYPQLCVATDNLIHHVGDIEKQATGVELEIASAITVSHNSIYHTPRAGINIGDGCFGGDILEYNDVFNTVLETGDHGAFNSWGRDRYWSPDRGYMDSLVAIHPELILLDAQQVTTIRNNRFRCDHGWDIDLDDGSTNYHICNNVCLNGGLKLREGFYRVVENNILINNSFHPHVWFAASGDIFRHNIVMNNYQPIGIDHWGKLIDDNLLPDTAALHKSQANGTDSHSKAGTPRFLDAASGNYRVAPGSPALLVGFKNFPIDKFGVQKPALKALAERPELPGISIAANETAGSSALFFLGSKLRSVNGPGDRSAYGLPDEAGVVVISSGKGAFARAGLKAGDIIRSVNGKNIKNTSDLEAAIHKSVAELGIIRNQQSITLTYSPE